MIISRVVRADQLETNLIDLKVILPSGWTEVGHTIHGGTKGKLFHFTNMDDGRIRLTLVDEEDNQNLFHAFLKPGSAVIFPIDGAGHTW